MAPDKDPAFEGMAPGLGGDASGLEQTKAKLDDSELSDDLPKSLQKVDLDLDDAPFLEDEEEPEPEAPADSPREEKSEEQAPRPWWKKKQIILPAGGLLLLLLGAAVYFLLLAPGQEPAPLPEPVHPQAEEEAPAPATPPAPAEQPAITIVMDPFLVEVLDAKGQPRFLTVKFAAVTTNPDLEKEFTTNIVVLRDAIYYYLKNKNLMFLTDDKNGEALKKDVLSVVNQFLSADQLDNLQIEEYLVK